MRPVPWLRRSPFGKSTWRRLSACGTAILLGANTALQTPEPRDWQSLVAERSPLGLQPNSEADDWIDAMASQLREHLMASV
jgi:hypothetical protein